MNDQERLAIAEELLDKFPCNYYLVLDDGIEVARFKPYGEVDKVWRVCRGPNDYSNVIDPIEAIDIVRTARSLAEREAARTPEERRLMAELERLKKALDDIATYGGYSRSGGCCADVARKALEGV